MTSIDENLKVLSRAVFDDVQLEAEKMLAGARAKAAEINQKAQEQAEKERASILETAAREAERVRGQALAITQLKTRTTALDEREKLLLGVFTAAREKLNDVRLDPAYSQICTGLLKEALTQLGASSAKVHADENFQKTLTPGFLEKLSSELKMEVQAGEPLKNGLGVIVETLDGRRQYDNTLGTRLTRMQDTLRAPVYHILMGDSQ